MKNLKLSPNMQAAMWTLHAMSNGLPAGRVEIPAKTFRATPVVTHLKSAFARNDAIVCEGWYYPRSYEHKTTTSYGDVTCPACVAEVMFHIDEHATV